MTCKMTRLALILVSLVLTVPAAVAQTPFAGMKYRIPIDTNVMVLINAEKMFNAPVADRERWSDRSKAAYEAGLSALPPDASQVVIAGRSDHEYGKSVWEIALVRMLGERDVLSVAQRYGGSMDNIEGRTATKLPNDTFVIQVAKDMLGSFTPANRQDAARWLRSSDKISTNRKLSPYMEKAFAYATKVGTPIVMAVDVADSLSEAEIKARLADSELMKKSGLKVDDVAKLIASVNGMTLGITTNENTIGAIRVDFEEAPGLMKEIGKPLLISILQNQGAMIDDIYDWSPSIEGNSFMLRGKLTAEGTRRVMSVVELPRSLADSMKMASSPGADQEGTAKKNATQQYYNSVTTLVEDLREKPKRDHVKTFGQAAMWYDRYARKIDHLPILNVDEDLLNYGSNIAELFRNAEMSMKGVGMRASNRRASNNPTSGGFSYSNGGYRAGWGYTADGYGPQGYTVSMGAGQASLQAKGRTDAIITRQERSSGAATVQQIWQTIDQETAGVRRAMTEKYQTEF